MQLSPFVVVVITTASLVACRGDKRLHPLSELGVERWTAGLPVRGDGALLENLTPAPDDVTDWSKVTGTVELRCDGCTLGDDKTPLAIDPESKLVLPFPHITFDHVRASATFDAGRARVGGHWTSLGIDLVFSVTAELAPRANDSKLDGCMSFELGKKLLERDPKLYALLSTTGATLREDGRYQIKIGGTLGAMRRLNAACTQL